MKPPFLEGLSPAAAGLRGPEPAESEWAEPSARVVATRDEFDALARRDDVPGALALPEVMVGVDTAEPELYFMNTNSVRLPLRLRRRSGRRATRPG